MSTAEVERLIASLIAKPAKPLDEQRMQQAYEYASGLFAGRLDDVAMRTDMTLGNIQAMHALSSKQTFYLEYFIDESAGREDLKRLGLSKDATIEMIRTYLLDTEAVTAALSPTERKEMAERSYTWCRQKLIGQLLRDRATDAEFVAPSRLTVHYQPDDLLAKAAAITIFRQFYRAVEDMIAGEPDELLAEAKQALLRVHIARLNALAAVDVYPALLSFEEQLTRSESSPLVAAWEARLAQAAPVVAAIHKLEGDARTAARETYVRHLDAMRQGAPFELDEVDETAIAQFSAQALQQLVDAVGDGNMYSLPDDSDKHQLADKLAQIVWDASQVKQFIESILADWHILSQQQSTWQEIDDRSGFAPDGNYQVIVTPRRSHVSVDSTRRIVNIPADLRRPLVGLYPAGVLAMVAHELAHVLQSFADYELGERIPLARIKGRRYRILREAGGVYQEQLLNTDYFGFAPRVNMHYLRAYRTKLAGGDRLAVARAFYESIMGDKTPNDAERTEAMTLAADRTARLYRRGGHNSQVLDYVEQTVICQILLRELEPEQVGAFLLGSTSFSLEDSALLHRYGLLMMPKPAVLNPAAAVMDKFYAV